MDDPLSGLIDLDRYAAEPLYQQLFAQVRRAILADRLAPGARLPASRVLARQLSIGRNTVLTAVGQLCAEGFLVARRGSGTQVADWRGDGDWPARGRDEHASQPAKAKPLPRPGLSAAALRLVALDRGVDAGADLQPLAPGVPAMDEFPHLEWARCLRRGAAGGKLTGLGYSHTSGLPVLRDVLARHLADTRGVYASPEQIIVTSSAQAAIDLVMRALVDAGDTVWLEDPGYLGVRAAALGVGARIVPVPVDADGMDPGSINDSDSAKIIYLTPSHQYPTGRLMPLYRRRQVLEIASARSALVLEDDYDSEFQFEDRPVASLQGLDEGARVAYIGSFAKSMLPGLRVGYIVAPGWLAGTLGDLQRNTGGLAAAHVQAALADFIERGYFRGHVRRMVRLYQSRRDALIAALQTEFGAPLPIEVPRGGKQFILKLPAGADDRHIAVQLNRAGLAVQPLSRFYHAPPGEPGLLLGYASCHPARMPAAARLIAAEVASQCPIGRV